MLTLYKGFKYDNSYDYIKTFTTKLEQNNYFASLEQINSEEYDYIREYEPFKVELSHAFLTTNGYNYLKFNNGYKDMYAFIIAKNYINDEVTELEIEIDVIQTFMFDIDIKKSFVERKNCNISEITDFDEGLEIGEHYITEDITALTKTNKYFAMFNGFKEQELIFNDNNKLVSVVDIPYSTSKPLTTIDDVQYPLYFMPLLEQSQYKLATYEDIGISTGGSAVYGDAISKKIFRFLKGYEAFATNSYVDSGGVVTKGYGITEGTAYYPSLGVDACSEELASNVMAEALYSIYAKGLYDQMRKDGIDMATVKQNHFDAFLSLAYNGGNGAVYDSPMYAKWVVNPKDNTITNSWATYYIRDEKGNILQGLIDRRAKERDIFDNNNYTFRPIGIVVDNVGSIGGTVTENNGNGFIPSKLGGDL